MDAKDWAGVRDRLVAALAVDGQFVPAVLLFKTFRSARPSIFKQGDITIDEATKRIGAASVPMKERGKRFVESLVSSTSGSRMVLVGYWKDAIEKDYVEAAKWYRKATEHGSAEAQFELGM
jgi:hypothetical protein